MSNDQKFVKPDVVIRMTPEQYEVVRPLKQKQWESNKGMILGSVQIKQPGKSGDQIALSYIPHELAEKIRDLANEYFGGKTDDTVA